MAIVCLDLLMIKDGNRDFGSLFYGKMLDNEIRKSELFIDISSVLEPIGLNVVSIKANKRGSSVDVSLIIKAKEGKEGVDECAKAYEIVYPRLSLRFGDRDLNMEVSTPGIQRVFKDLYEFQLFMGQRVRLYDSSKSVTISGIISQVSETEVILTAVKNEDTNENFETYQIATADIYKAKLDYKWEDVK